MALQGSVAGWIVPETTSRVAVVPLCGVLADQVQLMLGAHEGVKGVEDIGLKDEICVCEGGKRQGRQRQPEAEALQVTRMHARRRSLCAWDEKQKDRARGARYADNAGAISAPSTPT